MRKKHCAGSRNCGDNSRAKVNLIKSSQDENVSINSFNILGDFSFKSRLRKSHKLQTRLIDRRVLSP